MGNSCDNKRNSRDDISSLPKIHQEYQDELENKKSTDSNKMCYDLVRHAKYFSILRATKLINKPYTLYSKIFRWIDVEIGPDKKDDENPLTHKTDDNRRFSRYDILTSIIIDNISLEIQTLELFAQNNENNYERIDIWDLIPGLNIIELNSQPIICMGSLLNLKCSIILKCKLRVGLMSQNWRQSLCSVPSLSAFLINQNGDVFLKKYREITKVKLNPLERGSSSSKMRRDSPDGKC